MSEVLTWNAACAVIAVAAFALNLWVFMRRRRERLERLEPNSRWEYWTECVAIRVGGRLRMVGVGKAAEWLGISRTTLFNIVSDKGGKDFAAETVALVKREYPGLFKGEA